ncbi:MAG: hypothetical protein K0R98_1683 [Rickettsiaceae bacterium]|jgi:hypothetical protein|nr:hypothetical protein [Rickettsiaceae bacterium]
MGLSAKLRQDYTELADSYLNGISGYRTTSAKETKELAGTTGIIGKPEDVILALQSLLTPQNGYTVPEELKDTISPIQELLDSPEMYVRNAADFQEFKDIIKSRITNKIEELQQLSPEAAAKIIDEKKKQKEEANNNKDLMASKTAPQEGDDSHTISLQQMLLEQQEYYNRLEREELARGQNRPNNQQRNNVISEVQLDQLDLTITHYPSRTEISRGPRPTPITLISPRNASNLDNTNQGTRNQNGNTALHQPPVHNGQGQNGLLDRANNLLAPIELPITPGEYQALLQASTALSNARMRYVGPVQQGQLRPDPSPIASLSPSDIRNVTSTARNATPNTIPETQQPVPGGFAARFERSERSFTGIIESRFQDHNRH